MDILLSTVIDHSDTVCIFILVSTLVSWTMEDANRYCTLGCNHNKSTIGALWVVTSIRKPRISGCVALDGVTPPFPAPLVFAGVHRYSYSPSMAGKPVVSVTFYIDPVGGSRAFVSWRAELRTWC